MNGFEVFGRLLVYFMANAFVLTMIAGLIGASEMPRFSFLAWFIGLVSFLLSLVWLGVGAAFKSAEATRELD